MDGAAFRKRWTDFNEWERRRRRVYLGSLTVRDAASLFNDLWELAQSIPAEDLHRLRMRKIARMAKDRKVLERAIRKGRR